MIRRRKKTRTGRFWELFAGTGPFTGIAVLLVVVGTVFLISIPLGSSALLWTGQAVHGTDSGGIVFYTYKGQQYTIDQSGDFHSTTVYVDPGNPANAELDNPLDRWIDILTVGGSYVLAAVLVVVGFLRRGWHRRRRRAERERGPGADFGKGLDQDVIAQLLEAQRKSKPFSN